LMNLYMQRKTFMQSLDKVLLLTSKMHYSNYEALEGKIILFGELVDQCELWMMYEEPRDIVQVNAVCDILGFLAEECASKSETGSTVTLIPKSLNQNMIGILEGHTVTITLLNIVESDKRFKNSIDRNPPLTELVSCCFRFLSHFCIGNRANQDVLHSHMGLFVKLARKYWDCLPLIIEIYRDNLDNCRSLKESLVMTVVDSIIQCDDVNRNHLGILQRHLHPERMVMDTKRVQPPSSVDGFSVSGETSVIDEFNENRMPLLIQLLATFIVCDKRPIARNQTLILNKILELYGYHRIKTLITAVISKDSREPNVYGLANQFGGKIAALKYSSTVFNVISSMKTTMSKVPEAEVGHSDADTGVSLDGKFKMMYDLLVEEQLSINMHLIRLFTFCTYGHNSSTECKIQSLMDTVVLADFFDMCIENNASCEIKSTLAQFFFNAWLDTDNMTHHLTSDDCAWRIIEIFDGEINKWCCFESSDRNILFQTYIFDDICVCIDTFANLMLENFKRSTFLSRLSTIKRLLASCQLLMDPSNSIGGFGSDSEIICKSVVR
jgi:hypothetical protein